ncbi:hypothetical protein [Halocatena salina]|uniref:Photosynthesis system II assembly factor Ycf48/Hcf136-like domain-containing protein n=1 Tax=Halocatena salina TaxID=2934340 RepID=A0A8U0A951_9EURY|nr:hypothetical protein [Halocatena salina]UPM44998.1 hypothetical protein MW046_18235 [Halocatena salina]
MTVSSDDSVSQGFFAYYRAYARSGIHAASAAALTALIGLASYTDNNGYILLAITVYVVPPIFLYLTAEGENVPSVVGDETADSDKLKHSDRDGMEIDRYDDSAVSGKSATRAINATDADDTTTRVGERSRNDTGEDTVVADFVTSKTVGSEHDASSQRNIDSEIEHDWIEAETPTEETLLDVVSTNNGAYAVGEGGVVLTTAGEEWSIALERGPTANSNTLRGIDATTDGKTVWFTGDSGVLGRYEDGRLTDHSAPRDQTSTWEDIAVTGATGNERIHLVNGSGELLSGSFESGNVSWGNIKQPGSGSSISNITFVDSDHGHICDTNQCVYETTDSGESYKRIGIEDANATFTGVGATGSMVAVASDDGSVFRYDDAVWTRLHVGNALFAIDLIEETGLTTGDGGTVYELTEDGWKTVETPTDADLYGIDIGADDSTPSLDVAAGTDGTVIERHR